MAKSKATGSKKEKEKSRFKKRKEKEQRREERKANSNKGKGMESMMAYVDQNGNLTSTPPLLHMRTEIKAEDIQLGVPKRIIEETNAERHGVVSFFNDAKGYGFIKDNLTKESIFVHASALEHAIKENDKVSFEIEYGRKGPTAVNIKAI